jgi:osmotically-inducible protein OsmY
MPLATHASLRRTVLLLSALLGAACASAAGDRRLAEPVVDQQLAARVEYALMHDDRLYARHIDVDVEHGVVHLSGLVWEVDDLFEAKRLARAVPGVTAVVSDLELVRGGKAR